MTMPRTVRPERSLLVRNVSSAIFTDSLVWPVLAMVELSSQSVVCSSQFLVRSSQFLSAAFLMIWMQGKLSGHCELRTANRELLYSYRSASIGSRFAAFHAG